MWGYFLENIIKEIRIPNDSYSFISKNGENISDLKNLSKINIFVGENNSGKSRFLRSIIKEKDFKFLPNNEDFDEINKNIPIFKKKLDNYYSGFNKNIYDSFPDLKNKLNEIKEVDFLSNNGNFLRSILEFKNIFKKFLSNEDIFGDYTSTRQSGAFISGPVKYDFIGRRSIEIIDETLIDKPLEDLILDYNFKKLYIPILRGLRPLLPDRDYEDYTKSEQLMIIFRDMTLKS